MQTTAEDMGLLLAMLYYCAQEDGGTIRAVFPDQITQAECQQILATMQQNNIDVLMEQHGSRKRSTDFRVGTKLGKKDHLIEIKKPTKPDITAFARGKLTR